MARGTFAASLGQHALRQEAANVWFLMLTRRKSKSGGLCSRDRDTRMEGVEEAQQRTTTPHSFKDTVGI